MDDKHSNTITKDIPIAKGVVGIIDKVEVVEEDFNKQIKEVKENVNQYSQDTNKHLENIDSQLKIMDLNSKNNLNEIKDALFVSVKNICEFNNTTLKNMAEYNVDVFKTHHDSMLQFICQCTTPLYEIIYSEMSDLHKKIDKIIVILKLLSAGIISLGIVIVLLIIFN